MSTRRPPAQGPAAADGRARASAWREAVLELRCAERRRVFPVAVHVGTPGAGRASHVHPACPGGRADGGWDLALRTDVVAALLDRHDAASGPHEAAPLCWLTRGGSLEGHDADHDWLAAARAAYAEAGLELAFAVATHAGWREPASGTTRTWVRLRRR